MQYRPEIDGLRAIAVLSIIIYHAKISISKFTIFSGGFLGVDIFFVISGYLISYIILDDLNNNKFSLIKFYERRARRILPVLIFVVLITLIVAWKFLAPGNLISLSESIDGLGYAAFDGLFKPLLHTWSLSLEEQFYIFFPLLFLLIFKYFKNYLYFFIILCFVSLTYAHFSFSTYPNEAFYFLHTRIWELLAGSIIAYISINKNLLIFNDKYKVLISLLGFFLIVAPIILYKDDYPHPSFLTFFPVFGTCLIILFINKKNFLFKILSNNLIVKVGLISYSLYLWHYPVFAMYRSYFAQGEFIIKLSLLPTIFILSILTYFFIERPFRKKITVKTKTFLIIIIISYILIVLTSIGIIKNKGFPNRTFYENINIDYKYYVNEIWDWQDKDKISNFENIQLSNTLFIGASHADDLYRVFKLNQNLYSDFEFASAGNLDQFKNFLDNYKLNNKTKLQKNILFKNSNFIIFSIDWNNTDINKVETILEELKNYNKKIIITSQNPIFPVSGKHTSLDSFIVKKNRLPEEKELYKLMQEYYEYSINHPFYINGNNKSLFLSKKYKLPYLKKIDYICEESKKICNIITPDGYKLYWDSDHYTLDGAKFFGKKIYEIDWLKLN